MKLRRLGAGHGFARRRTVGPIVCGIVLASTFATGPTFAQETASQTECVPSTPEQMMAIGRSHLQAFLRPETVPLVPVADHARRTELPPGLPRESGGPLQVRSGAEWRSYYLMYPAVRFIRGYGDFRWVIDADNCEATVFFLLDYELPAVKLTIHLGERFRISRGLIEEVEAISWRADGSNGSCWPANGDPAQGRFGPCAADFTTPSYGPVAGCVSGTREETIAPAKRYLDALVSRDVSAVPFANDARRTEKPPPAGSGPVTGTSKSEIAASLQSDERFAGAIRVRDVRWFVDAARCQATAFYLVDGDGSSAARAGTRHHVSRFLVSGGLLHEIEDVWRAPVDPSIYEGSCWPQHWPDAQDETYRLRACPAVDL